jgi:hypothetical protein
MYNQDRRAWLATDVLTANHIDAKKESIHGWITEPLSDPRRVRFIRQTSDTTEAAFDVVFFNDTPQLQVPTDGTLAADELAQFNARRLGVEHVDKPCSDTYNTVAVKDPLSDNWLVWAMAATKENGVIMMGGHYRFTISADGRQVLRSDPLSRSCLRLLEPSDKKGQTAEGVFASHLVSLTPVETHVFVSLGRPKPIYVGTQDGKAWKVDKGHITEIEQDAPGLDGFSARAFVGMEEACKMLVSKVGENPKKYYVDGDTRVVEPTEHEKQYSPQVPSGFNLEGIVCSRLDIVPAPNDYKVLIAGMNLSISDNGAGHPKRMLKFEVVDGKVQFHLVSGEPLTDELKARINARVTAFQNVVSAGK